MLNNYNTQLNNGILAFRSWVSNEMSGYDASHDIVHIDNVVDHSQNILNSIKTSSDIYVATILTALAHDVCDKKYVRNPKSKLAKVSNVLTRMGFSSTIVTVVVNVIPRISFSKRMKEGDPLDLTSDELLVYRIVSDSDMLEAMGATGVVRTYMFQAVHGHTAKGAWIHTTNTLFRCIDYMSFEYSMNEGRKRLMRMQRICSELQEERKFM